MTNEEVTAQLQALSAQLLATEILLKLVLDSMPMLRKQILQNQEWLDAAFLHSDMTEAQIQRATKTIQRLCEGPL